MTGYYEAFNDPKVSLVDLGETPIVRMTDTGIETADGERPFDIVVWATGFDFGTGALARMGIRGRDGVALEDHWADGPKTFLGVQTTRLPELLLPRWAPRGRRQQPALQRRPGRLRHRHCSSCARDRGYDIVEVDPAAEEQWTAMVDAIAEKSPAAFGKSSYFYGANIPGKPRRYLLNSAGRPKLF